MSLEPVILNKLNALSLQLTTGVSSNPGVALMDVLFDPSTNSSTIETISISTEGIIGWDEIRKNKIASEKIISDSVVFDKVLGSSAATEMFLDHPEVIELITKYPTSYTALYASTTGMELVSQNGTYISLLLGTTASKSALIQSVNAITYIAAPNGAFEAIAVDNAAMNILIGYSEILDVVVASSNAMSIISNNPITIDTCLKSTLSRDKIHGSATAMAEVVKSSAALEVYTKDGALTNALSNSYVGMAAVITSTGFINRMKESRTFLGNITLGTAGRNAIGQSSYVISQLRLSPNKTTLTKDRTTPTGTYNRNITDKAGFLLMVMSRGNGTTIANGELMANDGSMYVNYMKYHLTYQSYGYYYTNEEAIPYIQPTRFSYLGWTVYEATQVEFITF